jgi:hypothetical protein
MAQSHVKINDTKLIRDINSKALLNTDKAGLEEYLMKREIAKKQQTEQSETKMRLSKIEEEMNEIKQLLRDIASIKANHGN